MFKLLKENLKHTWFAIVVIIMLLCVQAMSDLNLPDYTSRIINVGIQQKGVENSVPEVITGNTLDKVLAISEKDSFIKENYVEFSPNNISNKKYNKLVKLYPNITNINDEVYVLKEMDEDTLEELNKEFAKDLSLSSMIERLASKAGEVQVNPEIAMSQMNSQIEKMPEAMLKQYAIMAVQEEYKQLGNNIDHRQNMYILNAGLKMLGVALISMASAITITFLSARVAAALGKQLRERVFKKVLSFSSNEYGKFGSSSLITRNTNDIQQIQNIIPMMFRVVIYAPIVGIGAYINVVTRSQNSMAWIIGVAIMSVILVMGSLFISTVPKFKKLQNLVDKLNMASREILTGIPVIRAFNKEKYEEEKFNGVNKDLSKTILFVGRTMGSMMPALMFIMNAISLLIIWVGSYKVNDGVMQVGNLVTFMQYTTQIVMSFLFISMLSITLPRASISAKRINEVLDADVMIKDPKKPAKFNENKKGLVEFKNVSFRYPDADSEILTDINFTAKPGEVTAIIGSTGSGKSTVVNLIPRFYDVTEGEILVDGVNIKNVPQKDLRDVIGFVPQKGLLFSGTIESNIKYSDANMSDERMLEAARIAQAEEFITSKEDGYKSAISQGGTNVSGGQKQRLSIARAIAKNPEIFVFDDSFSALDFKTDLKLRAALEEVTENKTVIIVAQRISTIMNANQIIVLDEGKVAGIGTHDELLKNNEVYKQIALSQLSKEELENGRE